MNYLSWVPAHCKQNPLRTMQFGTAQESLSGYVKQEVRETKEIIYFFLCYFGFGATPCAAQRTYEMTHMWHARPLLHARQTPSRRPNASAF